MCSTLFTRTFQAADSGRNPFPRGKSSAQEHSSSPAPRYSGFRVLQCFRTKPCVSGVGFMRCSMRSVMSIHSRASGARA